mmetsp:Transcript_10114/g.11641  ORF Transcript_10114/g.11641 Transcript_10114/m.11641 type:complete len:168 (+) Transcript_10114:299-802(+)
MGEGEELGRLLLLLLFIEMLCCVSRFSSSSSSSSSHYSRPVTPSKTKSTSKAKTSASASSSSPEETASQLSEGTLRALRDLELDEAVALHASLRYWSERWERPIYSHFIAFGSYSRPLLSQWLRRLCLRLGGTIRVRILGETTTMSSTAAAEEEPGDKNNNSNCYLL